MHVLLTLMRFMKADFYFSLFVTKLHAILSSAITSATDSKLDDFTAPLAQEMHTCMSSEDLDLQHIDNLSKDMGMPLKGQLKMPYLASLPSC